MKRTKLFRGGIAALICSSMLTAQLAQAASPSVANSRAIETTRSVIRDVALSDRGEIRGQVLDIQGQVHAQMPVVIAQQGEIIARTETDQQGRFAVPGLSGGIYEVQTPIGTTIYRAWTPGTAPPAAVTEALVIPDDNLVRGQMRGGQALSWLANPWVLAGIVAAAIAIPLALDDDDAS